MPCRQSRLCSAWLSGILVKEAFAVVKAKSSRRIGIGQKVLIPHRSRPRISQVISRRGLHLLRFH
jgi:hypothetical protein